MLSEPGRPRSQKGAGPDLAKKWPILWLRSIEKWSFLEGGPGGRPGGGPGRSPEVVRDEVGGKSTRRSGTHLPRRPGRHPRVSDRKCLDAKRNNRNRQSRESPRGRRDVVPIEALQTRGRHDSKAERTLSTSRRSSSKTDQNKQSATKEEV